MTIQCKDISDAEEDQEVMLRQQDHRLKAALQCMLHTLKKRKRISVKDAKGMTAESRVSIAALFEIQSKYIAIRSVLVHKHGAVTHVIHYVFKLEIEIFQKGFKIMANVIIVTPNFSQTNSCSNGEKRNNMCSKSF